MGLFCLFLHYTNSSFLFQRSFSAGRLIWNVNASRVIRVLRAHLSPNYLQLSASARSRLYMCGLYASTYSEAQKRKPPPTYQYNRIKTRNEHRRIVRNRDFTMEGVRKGGSKSSGDRSPPVGSWGRAPVGSGDAEAKCKIDVHVF